MSPASTEKSMPETPKNPGESFISAETVKSPRAVRKMTIESIHPPQVRERRQAVKHFDKNYYDRFYVRRATRVTSQPEIHRLGNFICGYLKYLDLDVRRVADLGCGMGYWKNVIRRHFPAATYTGVEFSEYLCQKKGWTQGSVVDFTATKPFDLVICQGVLQYLTDAQAKKAITNLGKLTQGALYLEVLTEGDWQNVCDQSTTDGATYRRPGTWYRKQLARHFVAAGGGLFLAKSAPVHLYEMETLTV